MGSNPSRTLMCNPDERASLMRVAQGEEPADMVILNGSMVNVYTGELIENCPVSIKGKWVAAVGPQAASAIGTSTSVLDASGKTLIPGLIDGHTHLANLCTIENFLPYAIKGGTTTIITETMEVFPVGGREGVAEFLCSLKDQPVKILATAPAMVSTSRATHGIGLDDLQSLLDRDEILGLGESYWQALFQTPEVMMPALHMTLDCGKSLEGHTAGARGGKLMAYAAAGISSCHEPIQAEEVLDRLRLGIYVMIREGSIRKDLETIARIRTVGIDSRRLILATDSVEPNELVERGYLEVALQKAIHCGFDPIEAIQMTTLNVAEHFGLGAVIGGIAPGRCADILVLPDERTISPEVVISNGRVLLRDGELLETPRRHHYSERSLHTVTLPRAMGASDFDLRVEGDGPVIVRVIEMVTDLVTKESHREVSPENGKIPIALHEDILKVAAIDRKNHPGRIFVGLIKGFHMQGGAIAASTAWDTSDIIVVGASEEDMASAVNRIHELQGGLVVCRNGAVVAELALPIFGILSDMPMRELAERLRAVRQAARGLGVSFPDPFLSLATLTGAAIPYLRICEEGLVNLKDGKTLTLEVQ